jgi:ribose 1,5-bisphosphokinase
MTEAAASAPARGHIGPGCLVLVVGPSGAGKDTLIDGARRLLAGRADLVFPARFITRPPHPAEAHVALDEAAFERARGEGRFALAWEAHGLHYGVPATITGPLRAGGTVVVNVSRAVVASARATYANVGVVLVTAAPDILAARIAARGREGAEAGQARTVRQVTHFAPEDADVVIDNGADRESAIAAMGAAILGLSATRAA